MAPKPAAEKAAPAAAAQAESKKVKKSQENINR